MVACISWYLQDPSYFLIVKSLVIFMNEATIWKILATVPDPEIPVINVVELGIIREVLVEENKVEVRATPTYSGCPATDVIQADIVEALKANGVKDLTFTYLLDPPWTTDWISDEGREKLRAYGISIKEKGHVDKKSLFSDEKDVECPRCQSLETKMISYTVPHLVNRCINARPAKNLSITLNVIDHSLAGTFKSPATFLTSNY